MRRMCRRCLRNGGLRQILRYPSPRSRRRALGHTYIPRIRKECKIFSRFPLALVPRNDRTRCRVRLRRMRPAFCENTRIRLSMTILMIRKSTRASPLCRLTRRPCGRRRSTFSTLLPLPFPLLHEVIQRSFASRRSCCTRTRPSHNGRSGCDRASRNARDDRGGRGRGERRER